MEKKKVKTFTSSPNASYGGKKKKLVIKKKNFQKKDISEHFNSTKLELKKEKAKNFQPPPDKNIERFHKKKVNPSSFAKHHKKKTSSKVIDKRKGKDTEDTKMVNLMMQSGPPTAAQARKRTVRTGQRSEFHRKDRLKEESDVLTKQEAFRKENYASSSVPSKIEIMESIQIGDLAKKMNLRPNEVIGRLMKMGEMVTINKTIDSDTASLLASEYNCEVKVVSLYDETIIEAEEDLEVDRTLRCPVVTIMGHVDHGKTKLLDTIRRSNVVAGEAGAITQHIGAYQVETKYGKITFLDTPGHEAFSAMRARGAAITDIVVLVVAADDGVKQQTIEAIAHAKEAKAPIVVAVNKIDLPEADVERVKKELGQYGLATEEWGGDSACCPISAQENQGINELLEAILLQASMLKLTANEKLKAQGHVIEASVDPGRGAVATVLIEKGTLVEGDACVVGVYSGRVRTMIDDYGKRIKRALPSTPIEISGIDGVPQAGDPFQVVTNDKYAREIAMKRQHYKQMSSSDDISAVGGERAQPAMKHLDDWLQTHKELNIIIKADVQGSVEAIREGLLRLSTEDIKVRVIHGGTGAISESDINLASASRALIIAFQVRASSRINKLIENEALEVKYYSIIYDVIDDVKKAMEGMLDPDKVEEVSARVDVRQIFKVSRIGNVAGCKVISGVVNKNDAVRVVRNNIVIYTGKLSSLRRIKDNVTEVKEGFECGIAIESFNDLREADQLEFFKVKEIARKL